MKASQKIVIKYIAQHLEQLNYLSDSVAELLQIDRKTHNLWVSIEKNKLLLMTDDSAFATYLRFQQQRIRQHVNQLFLIKLKSVRTKIIVIKHQAKEAEKTRPFQILPQTANVLSSIADSIEDEEIRETLRRLLQKNLNL